MTEGQGISENVFAPPRANLDVHEGPAALWDMDFKTVRKLYVDSVNVRAFGVLSALGAVFLVGVTVYGLVNGSATSLLPSLLFLAFTAFPIAVCITSFTRPRWGRMIGIVSCVFSMLNFPFGTLIGALALVAYVRGKRLFGPDRLLHADVAAVYKQRKATKT